jgi:2-hydroxychromene-2-carboxylate isomerase
MKTTKLEFFYDYVSSYSYLANSQVQSIEGAEVHYRPMLLGAVMQASGNSPPGLVPAKGAYLKKDLARWAERYSIELNFNSIFPQNTLSALRLAIAAQRRGVFADVHQKLFDAMFVHDLDLSNQGVLVQILSDAELNVDELTADASSQSVKDELRANTEEAVQRGAFGAPTFFVGDEMFFGDDRMDFVREALARQE